MKRIVVGWSILIPSSAWLAMAARDIGIEPGRAVVPDHVVVLAAVAALLIVLGPTILAFVVRLSGAIGRLSRAVASLLRVMLPRLLWSALDWLLKTFVLPALWPVVVAGAMALWYLAFGSYWPF